MKNQEGKQYILTIGVTLIALVIMVSYNFVTFYSNAVSSMEAVGQSSLQQETERLNGYLLKGMDVLQVTAISVEYMMQEGKSPEEIEHFLLEESERYMEDIDPNFTGIYGLFQGNYLDGIGWVPDEDYVPQEREWYIAAYEAGGAPVIVSPYLDAQTNTIMISVSKLLYDGESVISLDIAMDEIQLITQDIQLDGKGYGFVVDKEGLVVAHYNEAEKGKNYQEDNSKSDLLYRIYTEGSGTFRIDISGERYTVFNSKVMDDWYVAMVVSDTKLFHETRVILIRNTIVCACIFVLIVVFCTFAYRRIYRSAKLEQESNEKLRTLSGGIVQALARTIDAKDQYTKGHSQRVAWYAVELAKRMGKDRQEQQDVYYAGLLHDLGKIRVPGGIINKKGRLTDEEFEQIKLHPVTGYYILKGVFGNSDIAQGAKFHHERYDGRGYPNGLQGENIPEIARILGVADAYDAMTSNRSYRKALPQDVVLAEIESGRGTQFDPAIADIMVGMIREDDEYCMKQNDELQKTILVADEREINREVEEYISRDGSPYNVVGAVSGKEVLQKLAAEKIDLILLDIGMPDMGGFEILAHIRENYTIPVVFITADKDSETLRRASEYGVEDYLTKPFLPSVLVEVIHSILQ